MTRIDKAVTELEDYLKYAAYGTTSSSFIRVLQNIRRLIDHIKKQRRSK